MNILLAEDRNRVRNALRILLEQQPEWKVIAEARDASELIDLVANIQPDLLLLDSDLPGIRQSQTMNTIRSHCPKACIVAIVDPQPMPEWKYLLPADGYATKVNSPDFLLGVIRKCIEKKHLK